MADGKLERLRFKVTIDNHTESHQINPIIVIGINHKHTHTLKSGINYILFDTDIYNPGEHILSCEILEQGVSSYAIGTFTIKNIQINGCQIYDAIYNCTYYPKSANKSDIKKLENVLTIGNRGKWHWRFNAPTFINDTLKLGLW